MNEFVKDLLQTASAPIFFVTILSFLEMTYWLLLSVGYNNAGIYAQFHGKIGWMAM